jgi:hypothetical protein
MSLDGTSCVRSDLSFYPRNPCDLAVAEHFWYVCLSGRTIAGHHHQLYISTRLRLKRDGTRAENRFRLSPKRTSPFKPVGASVQSTAGSRDVRISGSNAGYTTFRGSVKSTGYPLHSPVSPSLSLSCVTVCHQVSKAHYQRTFKNRWWRAEGVTGAGSRGGERYEWGGVECGQQKQRCYL